MGWVTLTLRKRELKQEHAYYQLRDLQISREKRQLARQKQYETASVQNQQEQALMPIKEEYRTNRQSIMDQISDLREQKKAANDSISEVECAKVHQKETGTVCLGVVITNSLRCFKVQYIKRTLCLGANIWIYEIYIVNSKKNKTKGKAKIECRTNRSKKSKHRFYAISYKKRKYIGRRLE